MRFTTSSALKKRGFTTSCRYLCIALVLSVWMMSSGRGTSNCFALLQLRRYHRIDELWCPAFKYPLSPEDGPAHSLGRELTVGWWGSHWQAHDEHFPIALLNKNNTALKLNMGAGDGVFAL